MPPAPPRPTRLDCQGLSASGGALVRRDFSSNMPVCFSSAPQAPSALRVKRASLKTRYLGALSNSLSVGCLEPGDWWPVPWRSRFTPEYDVTAGAVGRVRTMSCEPLARQGGSAHGFELSKGLCLLTCPHLQWQCHPLLTPHGSEGGVFSGLYPTQLCSTSAILSSSLIGSIELALSLPPVQCPVVINHM